MRTHQRLDCLCDISSRHQNFSVLLDRREAQPTSGAIDHRLTAAADELEGILHGLETHFVARTGDARRQSVKTRNVIDRQVVVTAHLDDLPLVASQESLLREHYSDGEEYRVRPTSRRFNHLCVNVPTN